MIINTKFNLKEEVYFLKDDKLQKDTINTISCSINTDKNEETYTLTNTKSCYMHLDIPCMFSKEKLFSTKEELLKSL